MRLELRNVSKSVIFNREKIRVLKDINLKIPHGAITAIVGNSGSGKTTLLNIMSLIDSISSGKYIIDTVNVNTWNEDQRSQFRRNYSGIIFQQYNLISRLTSFDNVRLPLLVNSKVNPSERKEIVIESLKKLGIEHIVAHKPNTLSGGEQQRVAVARALVNNPAIVFADEPTGNVDKENESVILAAFRKMAQEGRTVVIATHSDTVRECADKLYRLNNGEIEAIK